MIIPMKKYTFLVYHKGYRQFLADLQELGVLHVIAQEIELDERTKEQYRLHDKIEDAIHFLEARNQEQEKPKEGEEKDSEAILREVLNLQNDLEDNNQILNSLNKEINENEPWGEFDTDQVRELRQYGYKHRFYISQENKFEEKWQDEYCLEIINRCRGNVYFIVFQEIERKTQITAEPIRTPRAPLSKIHKEKERIQKKIDEVNDNLDKYAKTSIPILKAAKNKLKNEADLVKTYLSSDKKAEEKVMLLQGWVPKPKQAKLDAYCEQNNILNITEEPKEGDNVPILLKNNRFARLFESIGKLYSLPSYHELDLTPFFAPFFMLFFGFCLGDAGYGLLILVAASFYKLKAKKDIKPVLTLGQFLGAATVIFGVLTGTFFGAKLVEVEFLQEIKQIVLNDDEMFRLALGIGMVQILFGMLLRAVKLIRQKGFVFAISTFGWFFLIVSMLDLFLFEAIPAVSKIAAFISLGLILLFNDPKANIFVSIGKGLWDLYGITGLFGDVLSYIRLFALSLASAILGFVINDIAMQFLNISIIGPVLFVIFLIIGHSINLFISSLGSFVHPMRLTFVEFYKNAGFEGGGKAYQAFSKSEN